MGSLVPLTRGIDSTADNSGLKCDCLDTIAYPKSVVSSARTASVMTVMWR